MNLADVLGESRQIVTRSTGTIARTASSLADDGANVVATGQAAKPSARSYGATPALAAALIALAALGGLTALRVVFRGAVS